MRTINALRRTVVLALFAALAPACDDRSSDNQQGGTLFGGLANGWGLGGKATSGSPAIRITTPTSAPEFSSNADIVEIAGEADDLVGITSVTWTNVTMGLSGIADGTTAWRALVPLDSGENLVEVTVTNSQGATATDSILISR